jgi:curved DNA-binding protein CbpA
MDELVRQIQFGDTTFGAPVGIALLHKPWGYYELLGVSKDASPEDINKAYKRLAHKFHTDVNGGDDESMKSLNHIISVLLDDGGDLGSEHSQRRHYDEVCSIDSFFDGFIGYNGDRTKKLSEILLINLELDKKQAQAEHEILRKFPQFADLKERLNSDLPIEEKKEISKEMGRLAAETLGLTPELQEQYKELQKEAQDRHKSEQRQFINDFRTSSKTYFAKILDIFYAGGEKVTFGTNRDYMVLGIISHDNRDNILEMVLGGECYISGFPKVHFKAQKANVILQDPNVEGIFHIINGSVDVRYESSNYGGVIRARSPQTTNLQGFVQRGDLYIPQRFAIGEWWEKKPAVDIAVREGMVSLQLVNPYAFSERIFLDNSLKSYSKRGSLEEFLSNYLTKDDGKLRKRNDDGFNNIYKKLDYFKNNNNLYK